MMNCKVVQSYKYDAFITHCEADIIFGKQILGSLESAGFKCLFQARDFTIGASHADNIVHAITSSKHMVLILSKAALVSEWRRFEMLVALQDDARKESKRIIPVLCKDVVLSDLPYEFNHLTCLNVARDNGFIQQLIKRISAPNGTWKSRLPAGNVAHGLAWSYYYGYLRIVLPEIKERIIASKFFENCNERIHMCKKFILLFPESCRCFPTLHDQDSDISVEGHLEPVIRNRAGTVNRYYRSTVYSVKDNIDPNKKYFFIGEYITAILTMFEMEQSNLAGLSTHDKLLQSAQFYIKIEDILKCHVECNNTYKIIYFKDQSERGKIPKISDIILTTIKAEIEREKIEDKENHKKTDHRDNGSNICIGSNICNGSNVCNGSINPDGSRGNANQDSSQRVTCRENLHIDTSMMYEFMLFDKPEVVKDKSGKPKTITNGDECMNLLIPSENYLDEHSP
ncbi:hypothetical protein KUTeg_004629 [Tegillarca granosa]|uniref:TIR domain-containing protein n=1 Tax=Tegillarca granosa TaxID=220873 RepID=A0ABQ9FKK5_TEGGR|nr:hypothetical protein KUTeg_004629 [Tegillarca granosa]